jgi:sortase A
VNVGGPPPIANVALLMVIAIPAIAFIVAVVAGQARVLSRTRALSPAATATAARPAPVVRFGSDPLGWIVEQLRYRRWMRRSLSAGSLVVLLVAVGIIGYPFYTNLVQSRIQDRLNRQLASPELKQAYLQGRVQEGDSLTRLKISKIGVDVVVVEGTLADSLRAGAGHYKGTPLPCEIGNVSVAGHRTTYGRPFADLDLLHPGDEITLETPIGSCRYSVMAAPQGRNALDDKGAAFVVDPTDTSVVSPSNTAILTLTTCHPKGSAAKRLVIQAALITGSQQGATSSGGGA